MIFNEILDKGDTIFICGENEELRSETLDPILASNIKHFYFIEPKDNLKSYLEEVAEPHLFSYVKSIKEIDFANNNIIACGFKPVSRNVIADLKKHNPTGLIFFPRKLGIFKHNWSSIKSLKIIECSLAKYVAEYVEEHEKRALYKSSDLVDKEGEFFTNRGEMLDLHRDFIKRKSQRCCKIVGLKGIGKRAFIRRLKFVMGLGENCFEIGFTDKSDDISYLLGQLLRKFSINYEEHEIEGFHYKRTLPVVEKLFKEFDKLKNAKIIFYRIDAIYNSTKRRFYDRKLEDLFHQLLQRESYRKNYNRIYFVANQNFTFSSYDDRDVTYTVQLNPIHPEHIQYILEHEFNSRGKTESAQAIMKYDFDTIHKLLGGHPQIAKLFVEACDHFPMESIINDPYFRKKFDAEKAAYLMQHIKLDEKEEKMLSYLSLFTAHFTIDAIRAMEPQPHTIIENLRDKFLLEKEDFVDGHSEYYVPSIIQDYAHVKMDEETAQTYHNRIGFYYWNKAEDLKTPPPDALEAYRLALYHFSEAKNSQQEKNLVIYFKGIFLKKAQEAYREKDYENAWKYYHALYEHTQLEPKELLSYLICNVKLEKASTSQLYDKAVKQYPHDRFIKTAYANYLFENKEYEQAQELCLQVVKTFPDDKVARNLYAKILKKKGGTQMQKTVFISYSQKDMEFVKKLKQTLEEQNIGVTIDIEAAKFGDNLDEFMRTSVREADFTVSVVSENSLKSVWVVEESLRTLMHEEVEGRKRFVPIYIDKKFLENVFYLEIVDGIDKAITELKELTIQAIERNLGTAHYDKKRKRLVQLRNNLDTILERFNTYLVGDFSTDEKFTENLPKLVKVIREHIDNSLGQNEMSGQTSVSESAQKPISAGQKRRLQQEYESLQDQHNLSREKLNRLQKSRTIETDPNTLFKLDKQIETEEEERKKIVARMEEIEEKLGL